jgi:hypothetical protein
MRSAKKLLLFFFSLYLLASSTTFIYAQPTRIEWGIGLGVALPFYNSVIDADNTLYFDGFTWDQTNAENVTFFNVYMDAGPAITNITMSSDQNMTLSTVKDTELTYTVIANSSQIFRGISKPDKIAIDGVYVAENHNWTYIGDTLAITNATSDVSITFLPYDLTMQEIIALAIVAIILAIVALAMVLVKRNKTE